MPLVVGGPSVNRVSESDIQQIKLLVTQRSDIRKPITQISFDHPDHAQVETHQIYVGDYTTHFTVHKYHGRWTIDNSSIQEERLFVFASTY